MVPLAHILAVSAILFVVGAAGFVIRRNIITIFMCIELMLNAVNLAFIGFARYHGDLSGQLFVFFVIVVAAAEAAVGLGIIIALFRNRDTLSIDEIDSMKL
ncbi:MAG TPA: NADH-quinone oxidoreductase subunit NuoK [Terriglobia bacterium]|nr:NADH-quinone oxidoreductase subunit NuoK [Terriglobia bacterium]